MIHIDFLKDATFAETTQIKHNPIQNDDLKQRKNQKKSKEKQSHDLEEKLKGLEEEELSFQARIQQEKLQHPILSKSDLELKEELNNNYVEKEGNFEVEHIHTSKYDNIPTEGRNYSLLLPAEIGTDYNFKREIVWFNAVGFLALHIAALVGLYITLTKCKVWTGLWALLVAFSSGLGVTSGAHRLFTHKAYKATFPLRLMFIMFHTLAGQNCLYIWARDHRQHHKYSDTDADPHNANRGFFFSHVGWLMAKKHPAVIAKGKTIDMSDLEADWLVMFQKKYYKTLYTIFAILIPTLIPVIAWKENIVYSFFSAYMFRSVFVLNMTWLVNSAAHLWGNKPFDKFMKPVESTFVAFVSVGEGWHNYHHAFPWDYRAAEFGSRYSITTMVIDILAYFGLAYDLRTTPYHMVKNRALRTGDGTHEIFGKNAKKLEKIGHLDDSMITEILQETEILENKSKGLNYYLNSASEIIVPKSHSLMTGVTIQTSYTNGNTHHQEMDVL